MQERYTVLLAEAATIRSEFYANFGTYPTLPSTVKAFAVGSSSATKKPPTEAMTTGKMIGGLRRSLNAAIKRGDTAKTAQITKQLATLGVGTVAGESPAPSESAPKE
jgi:hypothetical protein